MNTITDIGTLIVRTPDTCGGRPRIAGKRIAVQAIAILHTKENLTPVEIVQEYNTVTLAEVHAALAYYYANQEEIDGYLIEEKAEYDRLENEYINRMQKVSQIRFYLDEDIIKKALIQSLRECAIDLVTTSEANNLSCSDPEQLIYATQLKRVIYTYNMKDFCRLHKSYMEQGMNHAGIIVAERQSYSIGEQLRGLQKLIEFQSAEDMENQLVFIGGYIRGN